MKRLMSHSAAAWIVLAAVVTVLAVSLAACDADNTPVRIVTGPSTQSSVVASIAPRVQPSFVAVGCFRPAENVLPIDLAITATDTASLTSVTIRLLDGTHLGGPMITFPSAELASRFGSTVVRAGTTRLFAFAPSFPCGTRPQAIAADLTLLIGVARTQQITVVGSLE